MKTKLLLLLAALFFVCGVANAQKYTITESGWGRLEKGYKTGGNAPYEISLSEIDIHRWRRSKGELVLDEGEKLLSIRLPRKKISYNLLTESYVHKDRTGWSYVERQALENDRTFCRVWVCTHEDGSQQILVMYPKFVQGYRIVPAEE